MRYFLLLTLFFGVLCFAKEGDVNCHTKDDRDGKTCFFPTKTTYLDAAQRYCRQFLQGYLTPVGSTPVNGNQYYSKFLGGRVYYPQGNNNIQTDNGIFMGIVRFDLNYGNLDLKHGKWNYLDFDRCYEWMGTIYDTCEGWGGEYETGYGSVFGTCIRP